MRRSAVSTGGPTRTVGLVAFVAVLSTLGCGAAVAAVLLALQGQQPALLVGGCWGLTTLFVAWRVRGPQASGMSFSLSALVSYLTIPLLGTWPAAGTKFVGFLIGALISHRRPLRESLPVMLASAGILSATVLTAGATYTALRGPHGWGFGPNIFLPYMAMVTVYGFTNLLLVGMFQSLHKRQDLSGSLGDALRLWFLHALLGLAGLVIQAVVAQFHLLGLVVVSAVLIGLRFTFQLYTETRQFRSELAEVLAHMLRFKDPYTAEHSARVAELAVTIGREMGLTDEQLAKLHDSALLHDIGKIAVPDAVLVKPGPLDPAEWKTMQRHVSAGGELLEQSPHLKEIADYVRAHHKHFDAELRPEALPLEARIIAVADAFDAMTSDRPYRKALPLPEAVRRLEEGSGSQFDPDVVQALLRSLGWGPATPRGRTPSADGRDQPPSPCPPSAPGAEVQAAPKAEQRPPSLPMRGGAGRRPGLRGTARARG